LNHPRERWLRPIATAAERCAPSRTRSQGRRIRHPVRNLNPRAAVMLTPCAGDRGPASVMAHDSW